MEAVISFDPAYRSQNLGYWAEAGRLLGVDQPSLSEIYDSGGGSTVFEIGGLNLTQQVIASSGDDPQEILRKLKSLGPEAGDWLISELERLEVGKYGRRTGHRRIYRVRGS